MHRTLSIRILMGLMFGLLLSKQSLSKEPAMARIAHYNSDNGLPQNTISMMSFDAHGNLWIGTQGGLVRFNGHDFLDLSSQLKNPRAGILIPSLSDTLRLTDGDLNIYSINPVNNQIAPMESGIDEFRYFLDKFILGNSNSQPHSSPFRIPLSVKTRYRILPPSKSAYILSALGNLYHLSNGIITEVISDTKHIFGDSLRAYAVLKTGEIYDLQAGKLSDNQLAVASNGLVNDLKDFWENAYIINGVTSSYALYKDTFYKLSVRGKTLTIIALIKGLPSVFYIMSAVYDEKNLVLAIGTSTNGVFVITQAYFKTFTLTSPKVTSPANERDQNNIFSVVEWDKKHILADNGVLYSDGTRRVIPRDSLSDHLLHKDRNGRLWTSRYQVDIILRNQSFEVLAELPLNGHTNCLLELANGKFVANKEDTLLLINVKNEGLIIEKSIPTGINFIPNNLYKVSDHQIWMLTRQGIYQVNLYTGQQEAVPGTQGLYFREVIDRPGGYKWLGTYGNGFFLYRGDSLLAMPLDAQKHLRFAHTFLPDRSGFLWISTNNGLFRVQESDLLAYADQKTEDVYYHYFDKSYGLNTNEFNGGGIKSGLIAQDGNFYFASMQGLVKFKPSDVQIDLPSAPLKIEKITADGMTYYAPFNDLSLAPGFDRISVKVNLPYFGHAANRQIFYRIQGLDARWRPIPFDNLVEIPNIKKGKYTLEFKKINGFGVNNHSIYQVRFEVRPYFYQHPIFRGLIVLLVIIITILTIKRRTQRLNKINKLLEDKVLERTEALEAAFRDITQQKEALVKNQEILQTIFQVVVHDLSSPLRFLRRLSGRIEKNIDAAVLTDIREDVATMHSSAIQAELLTADLLTWLKTRQASSDFRKVFISPNEIAQKNLALYQWIAEDKGIAIEHQTPFGHDKIEVSEDLIGVLIRNCLDNAIKHTNKGSVRLSLYEQEGILHLKVEDTGIGIDKIAVQQMNNGMIPYRLQQDKHLGMRLIFDVLHQLNGTMKIESQPGKGTSVHISIPLEVELL